jgi:glycerol uptake facilitator-like aquaporin
MLRFDSELDTTSLVASNVKPDDPPTHENAWFSWAPVAVPVSGALVLAIVGTVWALVL